MEVEDQQTQWSFSVHGHFKIGDISCRVVFDPSLFMCKTKFHVPPISMACPYRIRVVSWQLMSLYLKLKSIGMNLYQFTVYRQNDGCFSVNF